MPNKKFKNYLIFLPIIAVTSINAQQIHETLPATAGNLTGSNGSVCYSIGQLLYTQNTGANGSVSQGIQQPYEISEVNGMEEKTDINLTISVFPNPAIDKLILKIEKSVPISLGPLSFQLYDFEGRLIETEKIKDGETIISMRNHSSGSYYLKISFKNQVVKTFKIIKN